MRNEIAKPRDNNDPTKKIILSCIVCLISQSLRDKIKTSPLSDVEYKEGDAKISNVLLLSCSFRIKNNLLEVDILSRTIQTLS
jgi:hypothetical protein